MGQKSVWSIVSYGLVWLASSTNLSNFGAGWINGVHICLYSYVTNIHIVHCFVWYIEVAICLQSKQHRSRLAQWNLHCFVWLSMVAILCQSKQLQSSQREETVVSISLWQWHLVRCFVSLIWLKTDSILSNLRASWFNRRCLRHLNFILYRTLFCHIFDMNMPPN